MKSRRLVVAAAVLSLFPMASCASIPEHSDPTAVQRVSEAGPRISATPPPRDLDSFGIVRNFVDSAAAPENNHDAARMHLTPSRQKSWRVSPELLIVDNVDTVPAPRQPGTPENVQFVRLQADKVGWLKPDQSFLPESGEYVVDLRVVRRPDGQWRMAEPPPRLVASRTSFEQHYTPVQLYFLDHDWSGVVPDLRYVVSQPTPNLPRRVIDLLMMGPSEGFRSAMGTAIPQGVSPKTNPSEASDGALMVNLSELGDTSSSEDRLVAAQVVLSLQSVSNARVRLLEEGTPILAGKQDLRPSDVASYEADNVVARGLGGLVIVDERVHILDERSEPVPGPTGSGEFDVVRAGQSADGSQLAAVVRTPDGVGLRAGPYGAPLTEVPLTGSNMTAPTWRSNSELWTVVDGHTLVQVVNNGGNWVTREIDTREFSGDQPIQSLRLSHDGTRVAGLVGGHVVVAGVREDAGIGLERPVTLSGLRRDIELTAVEWRTNESLVATTSSNTRPVVEISVDGFNWRWFMSANLVQPLTALTVTPSHKVVVADHNGLWESDDQNDLWSLMRVPIKDSSIPFFPG